MATGTKSLNHLTGTWFLWASCELKTETKMYHPPAAGWDVMGCNSSQSKREELIDESYLHSYSSPSHPSVQLFHEWLQIWCWAPVIVLVSPHNLPIYTSWRRQARHTPILSWIARHPSASDSSGSFISDLINWIIQLPCLPLPSIVQQTILWMNMVVTLACNWHLGFGIEQFSFKLQSMIHQTEMDATCIM